MNFPRYPKYKDSGVEWLGEVPEHWEVLRTDSVLGTCRSTINADALSGQTVFHYSIPVVQETGDGQLEDGTDIDSGKLVVSEPQVLVSKLNPRKGTVCIAHPRDVLTVCSSEFVPLLPRSTDIRFVWYVVQSENYRTRLESLVESATKSHQRAAPSDIYRLMWAFPPQNEQAAIATFLDVETAKIDALIAEQQRLIELLQEKRQAVISHAVTEGLNSDVPMKDSGIEWLGEVPEHWDVGKLGHYLLESPCYGVLVPDFDPNGIPMLRINDLTESRVDRDELTTISRLLSDQYTRSIVCEGDLVISVVGQIGVTRVIGPELAGVNLSRNVARIQFTNRMCARFARWLFASNQFQHYTDLTCVGTAQLLLNMSSITAFVTVCPPFEEQAAITNFIDSRTAQCEMLEAEATRAIALLQERRSALISAAVTGQIDFRGLAGSEAA